jgi:hypothetical protein
MSRGHATVACVMVLTSLNSQCGQHCLGKARASLEIGTLFGVAMMVAIRTRSCDMLCHWGPGAAGLHPNHSMVYCAPCDIMLHNGFFSRLVTFEGQSIATRGSIC